MVPVFETVLVENGRVRLLDRHLARLAGTGAPAAAVDEARALIEAWVDRDGEPVVVRIDVDGHGVRATPRPPSSPRAVTLHPVVAYEPTTTARESKRADRGWALLAERAARDAGADEALLLSADGLVGETSRANVFAILGDKLVTPPVAGLLPGVTRSWVIERTAAVERRLTGDELARADGVFLTTAGRGVVAVAGREHPLITALAAEWRAL
jgi:branched-chain amino acid aminotransferase